MPSDAGSAQDRASQSMADLEERFRSPDVFAGCRILVLGDVMLDRYWWGNVSRISPEAPVPVVKKLRSTAVPGGAANVAVGIRSLGGSPTLIGVTGADEAGGELRRALQSRDVNPDHLIADPTRPTTVKTRVIAHSQHVVRVDEEETAPISFPLASQIMDRFLLLLESADLVVISDYAKGLLNPDLLRRAIAEARRANCRVLVDPKGLDYAVYDGAYLIAPNYMEALAAAHISPDQSDSVREAGQQLLARAAVEAVLITQGAAGMTLLERGQEPIHFPALARSVYDVTGAGDTVLATLSVALAREWPLRAAVQLANAAAGLAVEQVGTAAVEAQELWRAVKGHEEGGLARKG
jgi:rfaE bifunctional protein kinase chain/domain